MMLCFAITPDHRLASGGERCWPSVEPIGVPVALDSMTDSITANGVMTRFGHDPVCCHRSRRVQGPGSSGSAVGQRIFHDGMLLGEIFRIWRISGWFIPEKWAKIRKIFPLPIMTHRVYDLRSKHNQRISVGMSQLLPSNWYGHRREGTLVWTIDVSMRLRARWPRGRRAAV